jgi:hypothetical protein
MFSWLISLSFVIQWNGRFPAFNKPGRALVGGFTRNLRRSWGAHGDREAWSEMAVCRPLISDEGKGGSAAGP